MFLWYKYLRSYFKPTTLYHTKGNLAHELFVIKHKKHIALYTQKVNYSYDGLGLVFERFFEHYFSFEERNISNVLVLGMGAGNVHTLLQKYLLAATQYTFIELDKQVIDIAKRFFRFDKTHNCTIVRADAEVYIGTTEQKFDLIIVDLFIDDQVPNFVSHPSFIQNLQKCLCPKGEFIINSMLPEDGSSSLLSRVLAKNTACLPIEVQNRTNMIYWGS